MGLFLKRVIRRIKYFPIYLNEARSWEYESCKKCGSIFRLMWTIDDELWKKVMDVNDDGGGTNFKYRIGIKKCISAPSCDKFNFNIEKVIKDNDKSTNKIILND